MSNPGEDNEPMGVMLVPSPLPSMGEVGAAQIVGEYDEQPADSFHMVSEPIMVKPNEIVAVQVSPMSVPDAFGAGGDNPIVEKARRFACITPAETGQHGPKFASYTIKGRVAADQAANIFHNCLPGDLNVETAARLFGLDSLLSIAGTVAGSLGGVATGGLLPTLVNAVSDLPIVGDVIHSVVDSAGDLLGGLFGQTGGDNTPTAPPAPSPQIETNTGSGMNSGLTGSCELPRDWSSIRTIDDNMVSGAIPATILIEGRDFVNIPAEGVPLRVYINAGHSMRYSRQVMDRNRDFTQLETLKLPVPITDAAEFVTRLIQRGDNVPSERGLRLQQALSVMVGLSRKWDRKTNHMVDLMQLMQTDTKSARPAELLNLMNAVHNRLTPKK